MLCIVCHRLLFVVFWLLFVDVVVACCVLFDVCRDFVCCSCLLLLVVCSVALLLFVVLRCCLLLRVDVGCRFPFCVL